MGEPVTRRSGINDTVYDQRESKGGLFVWAVRYDNSQGQWHGGKWGIGGTGGVAVIVGSPAGSITWMVGRSQGPEAEGVGSGGKIKGGGGEEKVERMEIGPIY